jgi:hypothetical protein
VCGWSRGGCLGGCAGSLRWRGITPIISGWSGRRRRRRLPRWTRGRTAGARLRPRGRGRAFAPVPRRSVAPIRFGGTGCRCACHRLFIRGWVQHDLGRVRRRFPAGRILVPRAERYVGRGGRFRRQHGHNLTYRARVLGWHGGWNRRR